MKRFGLSHRIAGLVFVLSAIIFVIGCFPAQEFQPMGSDPNYSKHIEVEYYSDPKRQFSHFFERIGDRLLRGFNRIFIYRDLINTVGTVAVAVFTYTLWRSTEALWDEAGKQRKTAESIASAQARDMKESIAHAKTAADAATASVNHSIMSTHKELRAYVFLEKISLQKKTDVSGRVTFRLRSVWKNFGNTPALKVRSYANAWRWHEADLPPWFPFPDLPSLFGPTHGEVMVVAQGSEIGDITGHISLDDIYFIKKGWIKIFCWGWIKYEDIFGDLHTVRYCWRSTGLGYKKEEELPNEILFSFYIRNNCIDAECDEEDRQRPPVPPGKIMPGPDGAGVDWIIWLEDQAPATYARTEDWTPLDVEQRDRFGEKIPKLPPHASI